MTDEQLLQRISVNPKVMVGKPCIQGTRIPVDLILNLLAHGAPMSEILDEYSYITEDDVRACILFASRALNDVTFVPLAKEIA